MPTMVCGPGYAAPGLGVLSFLCPCRPWRALRSVIPLPMPDESLKPKYANQSVTRALPIG